MIPLERIENAIYLIRGEKVMLDSDLAQLYGVTTGNLVKGVKRNSDRFPSDFMFQLDQEEFAGLLFQIGRANQRGGRRTLPYAFTEYGVAMLSSILNSERAIRVNIAIMRAFGRLRKILASNAALARKVEELGRRMDQHDTEIAVLFEEIRGILNPPEEEPKGRIGFKTGR